MTVMVEIVFASKVLWSTHAAVCSGVQPSDSMKIVGT
jgi:hypothetical protein